jgi:hypothetical protein
MQEALVLELAPEGAIEEQLVDRIAAALSHRRLQLNTLYYAFSTAMSRG